MEVQEEIGLVIIWVFLLAPLQISNTEISLSNFISKGNINVFHGNGCFAIAILRVGAGYVDVNKDTVEAVVCFGRLCRWKMDCV